MKETHYELQLSVQIIKNFFPYSIIRLQTKKQLEKYEIYHSLVRWTRVTSDSSKIKKFVLDNFSESTAQLQQDLVARYLKSKSLRGGAKGFFCEVGASDGKKYSNTFLLESYGWDGILCEPSKRWHRDLQVNRKCITDLRCVWSASNKTIDFREMEIGEHSSISGFSRTGNSPNSDQLSTTYTVETVSLIDLLKFHGAPKHVDFISIDTEGSEYEILKDFDFDSFSFGFMAIESTVNAQEIFELLNENGYKKILHEYSRWDAWFVPNDVVI